MRLPDDVGEDDGRPDDDGPGRGTGERSRRGHRDSDGRVGGIAEAVTRAGGAMIVTFLLAVIDRMVPR